MVSYGQRNCQTGFTLIGHGARAVDGVRSQGRTMGWPHNFRAQAPSRTLIIFSHNSNLTTTNVCPLILYCINIELILNNSPMWVNKTSHKFAGKLGQKIDYYLGSVYLFPFSNWPNWQTQKSLSSTHPPLNIFRTLASL